MKEVEDQKEAYIVFQILQKSGQVFSPIQKPSDLDIVTFDIFSSSLISTKSQSS